MCALRTTTTSRTTTMMHSFLMGSLKGAWTRGSATGPGGQENSLKPAKTTQSSASAASVAAAGLMATLQPTVATEGCWSVAGGRRSTVDRGYDSLTECFEESMAMDEGSFMEDEEVFHLELDDMKQEPVVTRDVLLAGGTPMITPASSEEDLTQEQDVAKQEDGSLCRRPTLDWNSAVVQIMMTPSSDDDNQRRMMTPYDHSEPRMTTSSEGRTPYPSEGRHSKTPYPSTEGQVAKLRAEKSRSSDRESTDSASSYRPEDLSVYASDIICWKLELEKKHSQKNQAPSTNHAADSHSIFAPGVQTDITYEMRRTLLEWLVAVNRQFNFTLETWCLTVNVMDRFLGLQPINRDCLQLVGLTSFFIAAKMEEVDPPEISELVSLCACSYEPKQFRWMEYIVLSRLKFELSTPTAAFFLGHLVQTGDSGRVGSERRAANWPWKTTRALVEAVMCAERRYAFTAGCVQPSQLAAKIYDFVNRNFVMTCMVDGSVSNDLSASANNLYQMLHIELTEPDEL